jgi:hypothetical protein
MVEKAQKWIEEQKAAGHVWNKIARAIMEAYPLALVEAGPACCEVGMLADGYTALGAQRTLTDEEFEHCEEIARKTWELHCEAERRG